MRKFGMTGGEEGVGIGGVQSGAVGGWVLRVLVKESYRCAVEGGRLKPQERGVAARGGSEEYVSGYRVLS